MAPSAMYFAKFANQEAHLMQLSCRQQGSKLGSTWSAVSAAMKVMSYQKQLEKNMASTESPEAQAEQLRLMLDAMWASNALDIQSTVAKACSQVCRLPLFPASPII